KPSSWRIVKRVEDGGDIEEVIFTIQGIIESKELPPFAEKPRMPVSRYKYLRQSITLTGHGSPAFTSALQGVKEIHKRFDRQFPEGTLEARAEDSSGNVYTESIVLSNRYLTPASEAGGLKGIPFQPGVDPKGILWDMAQGDRTRAYIHTEENQVQYYTAHRDGTGHRRYEMCEPQTFRIGDIVQAQLTFVVIPMRGGKRKMLSILRSIALIDERFGKAVSGAENPEQAGGAKLASIKRRVGNGQPEDEPSRKKDKMQVDDDNRNEAV
ncbi:hypothetical protein L208DRAFT_1546952, partial [Tricholoma matsutake]